MKQFDFTLGFAVMAANEIDARVKLKELLMAISKDEILKAMRLVNFLASTGSDTNTARVCWNNSSIASLPAPETD